MIASRYYLSFSLIFWPAGQQLIFTFNIWCVANNTRIPEYMYISLVGGTFFFCSVPVYHCQIVVVSSTKLLLWCFCAPFYFMLKKKKKAVCFVLCAVVKYDIMIYSFRVLNSYLNSQKTNFLRRRG